MKIGLWVLALFLFLQEDVAKLVEQLGAEEMEVREKAEQALTALGEKAIPLFKKASADSTDPEVKARAKSVADKTYKPLWGVYP